MAFHLTCAAEDQARAPRSQGAEPGQRFCGANQVGIFRRQSGRCAVSDPGTQGWLHWCTEVTVPQAHKALGSTKMFLFSLSIRKKQTKLEGQRLFVFISVQLWNVIFNIFLCGEKRPWMSECGPAQQPMPHRWSGLLWCPWHKLTEASQAQRPRSRGIRSLAYILIQWKPSEYLKGRWHDWHEERRKLIRLFTFLPFDLRLLFNTFRIKLLVCRDMFQKLINNRMFQLFLD